MKNDLGWDYNYPEELNEKLPSYENPRFLINEDGYRAFSAARNYGDKFDERTGEKSQEDEMVALKIDKPIEDPEQTFSDITKEMNDEVLDDDYLIKGSGTTFAGEYVNLRDGKVTVVSVGDSRGSCVVEFKGKYVAFLLTQDQGLDSKEQRKIVKKRLKEVNKVSNKKIDENGVWKEFFLQKSINGAWYINPKYYRKRTDFVGRFLNLVEEVEVGAGLNMSHSIGDKELDDALLRVPNIHTFKFEDLAKIAFPGANIKECNFVVLGSSDGLTNHARDNNHEFEAVYDENGKLKKGEENQNSQPRTLFGRNKIVDGFKVCKKRKYSLSNLVGKFLGRDPSLQKIRDLSKNLVHDAVGSTFGADNASVHALYIRGSEIGERSFNFVAGVFDGHGGYEAAQYSAKNFQLKFQKYLDVDKAKDIEHIARDNLKEELLQTKKVEIENLQEELRDKISNNEKLFTKKVVQEVKDRQGNVIAYECHIPTLGIEYNNQYFNEIIMRFDIDNRYNDDQSEDKYVNFTGVFLRDRSCSIEDQQINYTDIDLYHRSLKAAVDYLDQPEFKSKKNKKSQINLNRDNKVEQDNNRPSPSPKPKDKGLFDTHLLHLAEENKKGGRK